MPDSASIDTYLAHDGYQAIEKALRAMTPDKIIEEVKVSALRGRGGGGLSGGAEVGLCAAAVAQAEVRGGQRR